jgi:hypothetical protein
MKYVWTVLKNLIVLGIAIAIFGKANSDYEYIVFSLLVMIYLSIGWSMTWHKMITATSMIALDKHFWHIRKLLKERHISNTTLNPGNSNLEEDNPYMKLFQESEQFGKTISEEKQFAEGEKDMRKERINFYIEAGFTCIIFLVALWHLLEGIAR